MKYLYLLLIISLPLRLVALALDIEHTPIKPQPPTRMALERDKIMPIQVSEATDTVLLFPQKISHVFGNGLTDGKQPGAIQTTLTKGGRIMVLKPLKENIVVLPKLVTEDGTYVLKLISSNKPYTVVEFFKPEEDYANSGRNHKLSRIDFEKKLQLPSPERQMEMIRLSREDMILRSQLPHLYVNYDTHPIDVKQFFNYFDVSLVKVSRFRDENCLVVHGQVHNSKSAGVRFPIGAIQLIIGSSEGISVSQFFADKTYLKPGEKSDFSLLIAPSNAFNPGHVSFENDLKIIFNRT